MTRLEAAANVDPVLVCNPPPEGQKVHFEGFLAPPPKQSGTELLELPFETWN